MTVDLRARGQQILVRPGNAYGLRLNWSVPYAGRTFTSFLGATELPVVNVDATTQTVAFTSEATADVARITPWTYVETTGGAHQVRAGLVVVPSLAFAAEDAPDEFTLSIQLDDTVTVDMAFLGAEVDFDVLDARYDTRYVPRGEFGSAAFFDAPAAGDALSTQVVLGSDSRLLANSGVIDGGSPSSSPSGSIDGGSP